MSFISGITSLKTGAVTAATKFSNVAAGTSLTFTAAPTKDVTYELKDAKGKADSLAITLTSEATLAQAANTLTANGIETVTINSVDTEVGTAASPTQNINTFKLVDDALSSIVVKGSTALTLTAADVTVTSVDARGLFNFFVAPDGTSPAGTSFKWVSGAVTDNIVVYGSTSGSDDIDVSLAATKDKTTAVTVYAGTNTVKGSTTLANVITGGTGADTITTGSGNDTIVGGAGNDKITSGAGLDVLTGGAGDDVFTLALNANGNTYSTITDFTKGDTIDMSALKAGASTVPATAALGDKVTLADTANFGDYLNAATASTTPGPLVTHIEPGAVTITDFAAGASVAKWFQYAGNTYVVFDNNHATTFQNGDTAGDQVVKLTGLIDLTTATLTAGVLALV